MFGSRKILSGLGVVLAAGSAMAQTAFAPDDPLFFAEQAVPGYYGQWYLQNQMPASANNAGLDINVAGAWARGLTGAGVVIMIADDGVESTHPDLAAHFQNQYSYSPNLTVAENNAPGFLRGQATAGMFHGTAVAGLATAVGGNGIGLTGVAPGSMFSSYSHAGTPPDGITQRQASVARMLYQGQTDENGNANPYVPYAPVPGELAPVRIKNHSYGVRVPFATNSEELAALRQSASWGVIHVFAAGNQRIDPANVSSWGSEDANKAALPTSTNAIVVAALGSDGKFSANSSFGANVFVTAPGYAVMPGVTTYGIPTTDRTGADNGYNHSPTRPDPFFQFSGDGGASGYDYTSIFGGTSAAAPIVSGVMALGVQANAALDVRMAQHLLARTSRVVDAADASGTGGWITNAAGYHFNNNYGFGLIDADAFTLAAGQLVSMTLLSTLDTGEIGVGLTFTEGLHTITHLTNVSLSDAQPLEYVQVHMSITGLQDDWDFYIGENGAPGDGAIMGDFEAWLISPSGTRNRLFLDDRNMPADLAEARRSWGENQLDWVFTSYAYWGENLNGNWSIELINHSTNTTNLGMWNSYGMSFGMGDIVMVPEPGTVVLVLVGAVLISVPLGRRARECPRRRRASASS